MNAAGSFLAALLFVMLSGAVRAEDGHWLKAESTRFVVYSRAREEVLRKTVLDLEAYDRAMAALTGLKSDAPAPKLDVYLVRNDRELEEAVPGVPKHVAGLYSAEAEMVAALAVFDRDDGPGDLGGVETLHHEYAHHFMRQHSSAAYPTWYVEGFAEYFAPTEIKDDFVAIGVIPDYRAAELVYRTWLPLQTVLFQSVWAVPEQSRSQFYGQSWLLTHYLFEKEERRQKLVRYMAALNDGTAPLTAFRAAFGMEVEALDAELRAYAKGKIGFYRLARSELGGVAPSVTVTRLSRAYDDLILLDFRLKSGLAPDDVDKTLKEIREQAAAYPDDPFARSVLARAEIFHGNASVGEGIADAALKTAPNDPDWLYVKGIALLRLGYQNEAGRAQLYKDGRRCLAIANRIRPNHVPTLYRYARSFFGAPDEPSENTTNILFQAAQLSPQINELVITTGYALMVRGDFGSAMQLLKPLANAPHGGKLSEKARVLLGFAEQKQLPVSTASQLSNP